MLDYGLNESLLCLVYSISAMQLVIVHLRYGDVAIILSVFAYSDDVSICFEGVGQCTYKHHLIFHLSKCLRPRHIDLLHCQLRSTCLLC